MDVSKNTFIAILNQIIRFALNWDNVSLIWSSQKKYHRRVESESKSKQKEESMALWEPLLCLHELSIVNHE